MTANRLLLVFGVAVSTAFALSDVDLMTLKLNLHVLDRIPASVQVGFTEPTQVDSPEKNITTESNSTSLGNLNERILTDKWMSTGLEGFFLLDGRVEKFSGALIVVDKLVNGKRQSENSCDPEWRSSVNLSNQQWVALVFLGKCSLRTKIENMVKNNVSAIVICSQKQPVVFNTLEVGRVEVPVLILHQNPESWQIASKWSFNWTISVSPDVTAISKAIRAYTSRVAMATGWLTLLMLCLLVCCSIAQVQRFRHTHSNHRAMKALIGCSGHAVTRLPTMTLPGGDFRVTDSHTCVICLESYGAGQVVRILPCQHVFHQCCVDHWLLLRHTCPICKLNILQHFGMEVDISDAERSTTVVDQPRNAPASPDILLVMGVSDEQSTGELAENRESCVVQEGGSSNVTNGQNLTSTPLRAVPETSLQSSSTELESARWPPAPSSIKRPQRTVTTLVKKSNSAPEIILSA